MPSGRDDELPRRTTREIPGLQASQIHAISKVMLVPLRLAYLNFNVPDGVIGRDDDLLFASAPARSTAAPHLQRLATGAAPVRRRTGRRHVQP